MTQPKDLAKLEQISQLILDVRLAALHTAATLRQQSLALLANLDLPAIETNLSPIAACQADLRYQQWAEARRAEINFRLARQTADMLLARDEAGRAFGKHQALRGIAQKQR